MDHSKELLQLDISYLETFSKRINTSWGILFYNEDQPGYYDSNHPHVSEHCINPKSIVKEVTHYYQSKKIIPRFYLYHLENHQDLINELKIKGFNYEELISPIQLWNNQVIETPNNTPVIIERVTDDNAHEALKVQCSIKEFGGKESIKKVFKEQFQHPSFNYYLLRFEGIACSTACLFEKGEQGRLESVATLEGYRGERPDR